MLAAAQPLPPTPPPSPPMPAKAVHALKGVKPPAVPPENAVAALVEAATFACVRFVQRDPAEWQKLGALLEELPSPHSATSDGVGAALAGLRKDLAYVLRRPNSDKAAKLTALPSRAEFEEKRKGLCASLEAAAELWTPPTRRKNAGASALPVLRQCL
jgi:hypothetical protein